MAKPVEQDTLLTRASTGLRDAPPEPNWVDISSSIISKVRSTARRTWPIDAAFPTDSFSTDTSLDTLRVSDHVVKMTLRRALAGVHGAQPTEIDLHVDGHACVGLSISVIGVYGDDLQVAGDELAAIAVAVLATDFGITVDPSSVEVHVDDIEERSA